MMKADSTTNYAQLLSYQESIANLKTFNIEKFSWNFWLEIPKDIAKDLTLMEVKELGLNPKDIDILTNVTRDSVRPWLVFNPDGLNKDPGFHMLQFAFRNNKTETYQLFYFSYMAQVDDPVKPYIYMERTDT